MKSFAERQRDRLISVPADLDDGRFESGDAQILKNIKKGATLERARQFTKDAHKLGLVIHGDFILGLPGETRETIHGQRHRAGIP